MQFTWDEHKNLKNIEKHKIDFVDCIELFEQPFVEGIDTRRDYGEERKIALGECKGRILCVVYTIREGVYRIISVRKASHLERMCFQNFTINSGV